MFFIIYVDLNNLTGYILAENGNSKLKAFWNPHIHSFFAKLSSTALAARAMQSMCEDFDGLFEIKATKVCEKRPMKTEV